MHRTIASLRSQFQTAAVDHRKLYRRRRPSKDNPVRHVRPDSFSKRIRTRALIFVMISSLAIWPGSPDFPSRSVQGYTGIEFPERRSVTFPLSRKSCCGL